MISAILLATASVGPYDAICDVSARTTAAAIVAREAGVPLAKVLTVIDDQKVDPLAQQLLRDAVLDVYTRPRHGGTFDEPEFISQRTAMCIVRLERETAPIPTGRALNTDRALRNLTGVK